MNQETFEQIPIANDLVIGHEYMKESDIVEVVTDTTDGTILYAEMPVKTYLRVTHSEPGLKGDTATNATKPAWRQVLKSVYLSSSTRAISSRLTLATAAICRE